MFLVLCVRFKPPGFESWLCHLSHIALSKLLNPNFLISKVRNYCISFKWLF